MSLRGGTTKQSRSYACSPCIRRDCRAIARNYKENKSEIEHPTSEISLILPLKAPYHHIHIFLNKIKHRLYGIQFGFGIKI